MINKEQLKKVIAEVIEIDDFDENDRFAEELGVDSMMILELVSKLERKYGVSIPEECYPKMGSFSDVYSIMEELTLT
jgi:acyl carrier protein